MLRMTANIGLLAEISGVRRTRSLRKRLFSASYSPAKVASGISRRRTSMSASLTRIFRPLPSPSHGREVRAGQAITMFSPRPCADLTTCFSSPSPKATRSETATVPHVIPSRVSVVRSFWWRTSCSIWRRKAREVMDGRRLLDLLRRPLHDEVLFLEPFRHLDAHAVGEADLDLLLHGRSTLRPRRLDRRLASGEGHEALGHEEHVLLLAHDDVRVRGVAGAQHHVLAGQEVDLHVEERRPFRGLGLGRDLRDPA